MQSRPIQLLRVEFFLKLMILDHAFLSRLRFHHGVLGELNSVQHYPCSRLEKRKQNGCPDRMLYRCSILPSEYTGVPFIFSQGKRWCKDVIKLERITIELKVKPDQG